MTNKQFLDNFPFNSRIIINYCNNKTFHYLPLIFETNKFDETPKQFHSKSSLKTVFDLLKIHHVFVFLERACGPRNFSERRRGSDNLQLGRQNKSGKEEFVGRAVYVGSKPINRRGTSVENQET